MKIMNDTDYKRNILDSVYSLSKLAKEENWVPRYDSEADSLSYGINKLSKETRIKYLNDEIAFYLTPNCKVEGIFIEYFLKNFLKHHKELRDVKTEVRKVRGGDEEVTHLNKKITVKIIPNIERFLKEYLASALNIKSPICL